MGRVLVVRALALYLPLLVGLGIVLWRRPQPRALTGGFLAFIWNLVWLIPLNRAASHFGWWTFTEGLPSFLGTPIDLWLGWAIFWGALPMLIAPLRPWVSGLAVLWLDFAFMPLLQPVVQLGASWAVGELVGVVVCLAPGLALGLWTAQDRRLAARASLQVVAFTGLFLGLIPWAVIEIRGLDVSNLLNLSLPSKGILLALLAIPLTQGATAVQEFWKRGAGTPLPLDPPKSLVASGPYAYVANPMQLSIAIVLALLSIGLRDLWFALGSGVAVAFSAGIAGWSESSQLQARFGDSWHNYRIRVRPWIPRWRPIYQDASANEPLSRLYVAMSCEQCRSVGEWIARRGPLGLEMVPAETSPIPLRRVTYVAPDGTREAGVAAFGRAMEHVNLGWALLGWLIRLPLLNRMIQLVVDASGGGPRDIPFGSCAVGSRVDAA